MRRILTIGIIVLAVVVIVCGAVSIGIDSDQQVLQRDQGEEAAMETLAAMLRGKVIDLDADLAFRAAGIGVEHRIPTADSIILATAWRHEALLWTTDAHFKGLRGVRYYSK